MAGNSRAPSAAGVKRVAKYMPTWRGRWGRILETVMKSSVFIMRVLGMGWRRGWGLQEKQAIK